MILKIKILCCLFAFWGSILLLNSPACIASSAEIPDYYKIGLEYKQHGDWVSALMAWLQGKKTLDASGLVDPRIGFAFIELATEYRAKEFYQDACDLYFWALSTRDWHKFSQYLIEEMERTGPLVDLKVLNRWRALVPDQLNQLAENLKRFWMKRDPAISTALNERLIEHWERIAYARQHFKKNKQTVYGTDDRGLIYVKYGKPDREFQGTLGTNRLELKRWTDVLVDNSRESIGQTEELMETIERFNNYPEYELWIYNRLSPNAPTFFIFGRKEGIGSFGLRSGVEEFVPKRAFSRINAKYGGGIIPGAILLTVYYAQLMHLNNFFADRYYDLEYTWTTIFDKRGALAARQINNSMKLKTLGYELENKSSPLNRDAPIEKSTFEDQLAKVNLVNTVFRFLDNNTPKISIITLAFPEFSSSLLDWNNPNTIPDYSVNQYLIVQDENSTEIKRLYDHITHKNNLVSIFTLDHTPEQKQYKIISEILTSQSIKLAHVSKEANSYIEVIGLGKTKINGKNPLSTDPARLELSDLIIGVNTADPGLQNRLPFDLIPSTKIWPTDFLKIYMEIYHLFLDSDGMAHFKMDFQVAKLEGKKNKRKRMISLSFDFDSDQPNTTQSFNIDISKLKPGNYELSVQVRDMVSKQAKIRTVPFSIVKED